MRTLVDDLSADDYNIDILGWIRRLVSRWRTQHENLGQMVLRELVQNADDAEASILVLRFEVDALFVANDGHAFTTEGKPGELSDFEKVRTVLGYHKARDPWATGNFGSGFQTVYLITNSPEIHSNGWSRVLNPVRRKMEHLIPGEIPTIVAPYSSKDEKDPRGVLFRLPWRDDDAAEREIPGAGRPFADSMDFPRWNASTRRKLFEDLTEYAPEVLLCCKVLRTIRFVWVAEGAEEARQARRDFSLTGPRNDSFVGTVSTGVLGIKGDWLKWAAERRNDSRLAGSWHSFNPEFSWLSKPHPYPYLVLSDLVRDDQGSPLHVGLNAANADGSLLITSNRSLLRDSKEDKRNDIHLLLPLFDSYAEDADKGRALLYSTIPLPKRSLNAFAFTATFYPDETRFDVDVQGKAGEWHRAVVLSLGRLYSREFHSFLEKVRSSKDADDAAKQAIILNGVPRAPLHKWMRPDEPDDSWSRRLNGELISRVLAEPLILNSAGWVAPRAARWIDLPGQAGRDGGCILGLMGVATLTERFTSHDCFKQWLAGALSGQKVDAAGFGRIFSTFLENSGGQLYYSQSPRGRRPLSRTEVEALIRFCLTRPDRWGELADYPVIPGQDLLLRRLDDYPALSPDFSELSEILTSGMKIHPDFVSIISDSDLHLDPLGIEGIVALISRLGLESKAWSQGLPEDAQRVLSHILIRIAGSRKFSLHDSHAELRFVPTAYKGKVLLLPPNAKPDDHGVVRVFLGGPRKDPEYYDRSYIFAPEEQQREWLTAETRQAIRFLALVDASKDEVGRVCEMLHLIGLQYDAGPLNFVRHFLASKGPARGDSIFDDKEIKRFLGTAEEKILVAQKKAYTKALLAYFDRPKPNEAPLRPEDMKKVPCLYDPSGAWLPAGRFIEETTEVSSLLGYHSLSPDFKAWPSETLRALGVPVRPEPKEFVASVRRFAANPSENRTKLTNLAIYALTSESMWERELQELSQIEWIAVQNGKLERPTRSLVNTALNRKAVGEDFPRLFDISQASPSFSKRLESADAVVIDHRARELGFEMEPGFEDLVSVLDDCMNAGKSPPSMLFEALSSLPNKVALKELANRRFFDGKVWRPGEQVIVNNDPGLASVLQGAAAVLPPKLALPIQEYLTAIGATFDATPLHLVQALQSASTARFKSVQEKLDTIASLWNRLEAVLRSGEQPFLISEPLRLADLLYAVDNRLTPVGQVVLPPGPEDSRLFLRPGWYGDWYVYTERNRVPHFRALLRLGALEISRVRSGQVESLLSSFAGQTDPLSSEDLKTVLNLLTRAAKEGPLPRFGNNPIWPIRVGEDVYLRSLDNSYIDNTGGLEQFEPFGLPFLYKPAATEVATALEGLALNQRTKPRGLRESLSRTLSNVVRPREDEDAGRRFSLIADALSHLPSISDGLSLELRWLKGASGYTTAAIELKVSVDGWGATGTERPSCYIDRANEATRVYLCVDHTNLLPDLAAAFLGRLLPGMSDATKSQVNPARESLRQVILYLLREPPSIWKQFYPELPEYSEYLPPLQSPDIEYKPGYAETRDQLLHDYQVCQICGRRTPLSERGSDTCETITSIISMRGGSYRGEFDSYEPANTLFLCPSHQALFRRGLVRFKVLEGIVGSDGRPHGSNLQEVAKGLREMASSQRGANLRMEVFEIEEQAPSKDPVVPEWRHNVPLRITDEHATALLNRLARWVERKGR